VVATLNEIGAAETPRILVLNKIDRIPGEPDAAALARRILADPRQEPAGAVAISAYSGQGIDALLQRVDQMLALDPVSICVFRFPAAEGAPLHLLHERGRVIATKYDGEFCVVRAAAPESVRRKLRAYLATGS
jgi:50S ribosomal subunit-associated GTPase HflX